MDSVYQMMFTPGRSATSFITHFVLFVSCSAAPHDAIIAIVSLGSLLPIDAGLRTESKNGTTFQAICSVAPIYATTTIASCGAALRL
jgi:hypothetical protein